MEISSGKAAKKVSPEGRSEQEGGLGSPDPAARSGEVAKEDWQLACHRTGSRKVREPISPSSKRYFCTNIMLRAWACIFFLTRRPIFPWPCAALAPSAPCP